MRAEFIPDSKEEIQDTLMRLKQRVGPDGVVFTSGAWHICILASELGLAGAAPCCYGDLRRACTCKLLHSRACIPPTQCQASCDAATQVWHATRSLWFSPC